MGRGPRHGEGGGPRTCEVPPSLLPLFYKLHERLVSFKNTRIQYQSIYKLFDAHFLDPMLYW